MYFQGMANNLKSAKKGFEKLPLRATFKAESLQRKVEGFFFTADETMSIIVRSS
jgi:hypothetical protein